MLNVGPLSCVRLAIGQLFRVPKILKRGFELDPFLSSEAGELVSLDYLDGLTGPRLLQFIDGLQGQTLSFTEVISYVSSVRLLISSSIGGALKVDSYIRQLLLEDLWVHSYFLAESIVNFLLDDSGILFRLRLANFCFHARILQDAFAQLRHFLAHGNNGLLRFDDALGTFALVVEKPEPKPHADEIGR